MMQTRMKNPAVVIPEAMQAIQSLIASTRKSTVPANTLELTHLCASQINGCSWCIESGTKSATKSGESPERLLAVSAWRTSPLFDDAERAALGLTEAVTRLADQDDPVPDPVWEEATKHYNETELATQILWITTTNDFNRLNVSTRQVPGSWG